MFSALTTRGYHEALQKDLLHIPGPTVRTDKGYPEIGRGCYVDGTFSIIRSGRHAAFKAHLSSIFTDILFTVEEEKNRALPFLNALARRRDVRYFITSVFRKTTNTLQMIPFKSNHPQAHRQSCVETLFKRVQTHCSTLEAKEEELRYLKRQFSRNG